MTKIIPLQLLESTAGWLCLNNSVLFDNTCKCIVISLKKYGRLIQHGAHNCGTDPNIITVIIVAFLENATIGYSLESLCVCVRPCLCVFAR